MLKVIHKCKENIVVRVYRGRGGQALSEFFLIFGFSFFLKPSLSDSDNMRAFANMRKSGSKYLLMTTHSVKENTDLIKRWRAVNFFKSPYNMPRPLCLSKETHQKTMYIMLYDLEQLQRY